MRKITEIRSKSLRKERNNELVRRMRGGEQLSSFNSFSSWFPPRPTIEKDSGALEKLYGASVTPLNQLSNVNSEAMTHESVCPLRLA